MRRLAPIGLGLGLLALGLALARTPRAPEPAPVEPPAGPAVVAGLAPPDAVPPAAGGSPSVAALPPSEPPAAPPPEQRLADPAGEPSPAFVRGMLEDALAEHLPSHKLSPDDLERLTGAVLALRSAQQELRELPWEPEHAEHRKGLLARVAGASQTFEEVLDMDLAEFSEAVQPGVGIDRDDPAEAGLLEPPGEPEFLEPR